MENSIPSSLHKLTGTPDPSIEDESQSEESGWTQYIEDFEAEAYNNKEDHGVYSGCSSYKNDSMVSDAGTGLLEWKQNINTNNIGMCSFGGVENMPKRLNFKKTIPFDDSLEDTASSPVNSSPKITSFFKRMDINSRKMESNNGSPMGNEISVDEHMEYNYNINGEHEFKGNFVNDAECISLKRKGLCIVPISMVVDYLG